MFKTSCPWKVEGSESAPLPITKISINKIRSERFVLTDHPQSWAEVLNLNKRCWIHYNERPN